MQKTNDITRKSRTHFEQVPVDVVKEIAEVDGSAARKTAPEQRLVERRPGKKNASAVPARSPNQKRK